jgi:hypothetical protein
MRADMSKVLCERPRLKYGGVAGTGKGYCQRLRKLFATPDGPPSREGIKTRYGGQLKWLNENLGPLRRYIESQVGRPWNKVHAEICANIDAGNNVQSHILVHLYQYVERHVELIAGVPHPAAGGHWRQGNWYVCPKSGLLLRWPAAPARLKPAARQPPPAAMWIAHDQMCRQRADGRWELLEMRPWPNAHQGRACDAALGKPLSQLSAEAVLAAYGKLRWCVAVRVLKPADLRSLPIPDRWWRKALPAPNLA